jgi:hypothetical protein
MDMNNPVLALLFVFFVFVTPLLFVAAPFLFFGMVATIAGYKGGGAGSTSPRVHTPLRQAYSSRSSGLHVVGYVRLVSSCPREGKIVSWKPEIQLDEDPVKVTRIASRCEWVTSGPAGCWRRLTLMEASTTTPGRSDANPGNA